MKERLYKRLSARPRRRTITSYSPRPSAVDSTTTLSSSPPVCSQQGAFFLGITPGTTTATSFFDAEDTSTTAYTQTVRPAGTVTSACTDASVIVQTPRPIPSADCSRDGYLIQQFTLYRVSLTSGAVEKQAALQTPDGKNISVNVNAIGYNPLDDYLYGTPNKVSASTTTGPWNLLRFDTQGQFQNFTATGFTWSAGDIDCNGQYIVREAGGNWAQFNLNPNLPNYLRNVNNGSDAILPTAYENMIDWALVPGYPGYLFAPVFSKTSPYECSLLRWSPDTRLYEVVQKYGSGPWQQTGVSQVGSSGFGAAYATNDGRLFAGENGQTTTAKQGTLFEFSMSNSTWRVAGRTPQTSSNDGARCVRT